MAAMDDSTKGSRIIFGEPALFKISQIGFKSLLFFSLYMEREFHVTIMIVSTEIPLKYLSFLCLNDEFAYSLQNRCD